MDHVENREASLVEVVHPWDHSDRVLVPATAVAAQELDDTSGRRRSTPIRKAFVRTSSDAAPPMARVYAGGRSGTVALKLYLALVWRCSRAPFSTDKPARAWATLLGLEDPEGRGARRVAAALKTLAKHHLIESTPQPGGPNKITLLDESGDGSTYSPPSTAYTRAPKGEQGQEQRERNTYFKVPSRLWVEGHIQSLDGPALTFLLILMAEQGADGARVWFSTTAFPSRYRISHQTRAAGTKQLKQRGLLLVEREALAAGSQPSVFDTRRYRSVYRLSGPALLPSTEAPLETTAGPKRSPHAKRPAKA